MRFRRFFNKFTCNFFRLEENVNISENLENKEVKTKIKLNTNVDEFKSIEEFNPDAYIQDTFEQLFHAIKVDNWSCNYQYGEIDFKKDSVTLKIEFSLYKGFKIKTIMLISGYTIYYYMSDLDSDLYKFFYEIYVKEVMKKNDTLKKSTDYNLESINKVLGRDIIRDSKIDWILKG
jgi:hypothetical protein